MPPLSSSPPTLSLYFSLQPYWPSCTLNPPSTVPLPGLCSCCSLCLSLSPSFFSDPYVTLKMVTPPWGLALFSSMAPVLTDIPHIYLFFCFLSTCLLNIPSVRAGVVSTLITSLFPASQTVSAYNTQNKYTN